MKFRRERRLGEVLAALLIEEIEEDPALYRFLTERRPSVVPVPLGRRRLRERGFNQAGVLGRRIAARWRLDFARMLVRVQETPPQSLLSYQERRRGLKGAFRIKKTFGEAPRAALLVDDVVTTGATIKACTLTLRRAGVREVWALTAAH
jgi:ComF family protein